MDNYSIDTFIGSQVEIRDFSGLPEDDGSGHVVVITEAAKVASKNDQNSGLIKLNVQVQGGEFSGRKGVVTLNLWNQSERARQIAAEQFAKITYCLNLENTPVNDLRVLMNKPFRVFVRRQALTEEQIAKGLDKSPYTEIYDFADVNGAKRWISGHSSVPSAAPSAAPSGGSAVQEPAKQPAQGTPWGGNAAQQAQPAQAQQPAQQAQPATTPWGNQQPTQPTKAPWA